MTSSTGQWWPPHPLDSYGQWFLLEIAESANPPETQPPGDDWCGDVEIPARDGWRVVFFYDCGELDYIDSFITPAGERLEVWVDEVGEWWPPLMNWRGVGDLKRLQSLGPAPEKPPCS